jgi:hypothetical protein
MRTALREFTAATDRITAIADWLDTQTQIILATAGLLPAINAMQCSCVVLLSGYFESFLRDVMQAAVQDINRLNKPFLSLPERMRHLHFHSGAQALKNLAGRERRETPGVTVGSQDMAIRLASVAGAVPYAIVWEAFADTQANPGPDTVRDLLKGLEIENPWQKMDAHCGQLGAEYLRTWLGTFILQRNQCAHTGNVANPPGNQDLRDYARNMLAISSAIVALLEARVVEFSQL